MSNLTREAIHQLKAIEPDRTLTGRTIDSLITSKRCGGIPIAKIILGLAAAVGAFLLITALPRYATARTLESIKGAMAGKILHTRVYMFDGETERLNAESWTDGVRRRHESLAYTKVSDGSVTIQLAHQLKVADITDDPGYKYAPSGFDIDSILDDMTGRDGSGDVVIETLSVGGVDKLVVKYRGKIADYTFHCDPRTRLPETLRIMPTSPLSADKSPVFLRFDYLEDEGDLFSTSVPEGYTVYDLRKGFDAYAKTPLIGIADPEFKLFSFDINENGEVFAFCATNADLEIDLGIDEPYAGPIRLESLDKARQPRLDKLRGHFLAWVVPQTTNADFKLTIRLAGKPAITKQLRAQRIKGFPDYYSLASHVLTDRVDVPLRDLHIALEGERQLPIAHENGLVINATFEPVTSVVKGTVRNTSAQRKGDVALVFKLLAASPWASGKVIQVGSVLPGEVVKFSEKLAERRPGAPIPLVDVTFTSLYDPAVGIRISPYRRR